MGRTFTFVSVLFFSISLAAVLGTGCPPPNNDLQKIIVKALEKDGCRGCDCCEPAEGEGECTFTPKICVYGPFLCEGESKFEKCIPLESYRFEDCSTGAEVLSREWFLNGQSQGSDPSFSECFDASSSVTLSVNTVCGTFTTSTTIEVGYNIEACFEIAYDPVEPLVIYFDTNCTQGNLHLCFYPIEEWDFGDGTQDPD